MNPLELITPLIEATVAHTTDAMRNARSPATPTIAAPEAKNPPADGSTVDEETED